MQEFAGSLLWQIPKMKPTLEKLRKTATGK
jgi:hypothetical protein